jgi:hypothetical protein
MKWFLLSLGYSVTKGTQGQNQGDGQVGVEYPLLQLIEANRIQG